MSKVSIQYDHEEMHKYPPASKERFQEILRQLDEVISYAIRWKMELEELFPKKKATASKSKRQKVKP